jgi:hypothetical protein
VEPQSALGTGDGGGTEPPAVFRAALDALAGYRPRPEIQLEPIPAPQRLAPFASALAARVVDPDGHMVDDAMFSEVAWSWLTDALTEAGAAHHAVGGTVTRTASTRFGDLAGPEHSVDVEIRASWTAADAELDRHLAAWLEVIGNAAGLPPPGVRLLGPSGSGSAGSL